jgi:SPP1 family phage portal protein
MIIRTAKPLDDTFIVKAVRDKLNNNHRLQRLQDYYEGKHEILLRDYNDPTKPNNKIVINYCKYIADFLTAYLVGVPVKYAAPQIILDNLNYNDNDETTQEIVRRMNVMGFGAELLYVDNDSIARFACIDPREAIFIMDDTIEEIITAFIRVYPKEDETEGYNVIVYTAENYTQYELSLAIGEVVSKETAPHLFKDVPAILYSNNNEYSGTFEGVMSLQDALNKLMSDEVNDFESFTDAYLVLTGLQATQPDDIAKMKQDRVLLMDGDAKAEWLIKTVNNAHIKELKESITTKICTLGNVPDMIDLGSFGASGVALKFKLLSTEIQAAKQERTVNKGIQRRLELLYNILRVSDSEIGNYTDVKIEFERNFIMLAEDKTAEMQLDLQRYNNGLISRKQFIMKYDNLTPKEADEEIEAMEKENPNPFGFGELDFNQAITEKEISDVTEKQ